MSYSNFLRQRGHKGILECLEFVVSSVQNLVILQNVRVSVESKSSRKKVYPKFMKQLCKLEKLVTNLRVRNDKLIVLMLS